MPTTPNHTFNGKMCQPAIPDSVVELAGKFKASTNFTRGTVLGIVTATGAYAPYSDAAGDGTNVARAVCKYDIRVDANGRIAYGTDNAIGEHGQTYATAPVYVQGYFKTTDLTGLDANGAADLGKIVQGVLADGILRIT